jgi:ankyrin repeat protein
MEVPVVLQRIIMNNDLLQAAKSGDETSFAELLGLGVDNGVQGQQSEITIDPSIDRHVPIKPIAAIDEPDFFLGVTPVGNSLLHITANSGFLNTTKKLLRIEKSLLKARNKTQETPLHCAARSGSDDIVSYLIDFAQEMEEGHEVVMEEVLRDRNEDGETALHDAARHDRVDVVRTLISADPGLASVVDKIRISPLYLAAALGHLKVVQVMIEGLKGTEDSSAAYAGPRQQTVLHVTVLRSKGKERPVRPTRIKIYFVMYNKLSQ